MGKKETASWDYQDAEGISPSSFFGLGVSMGEKMSEVVKYKGCYLNKLARAKVISMGRRYEQTRKREE